MFLCTGRTDVGQKLESKVCVIHLNVLVYPQLLTTLLTKHFV